eukprot:5668487-Amphidinium_carterae.1
MSLTIASELSATCRDKARNNWRACLACCSCSLPVGATLGIASAFLSDHCKAASTLRSAPPRVRVSTSGVLAALSPLSLSSRLSADAALCWACAAEASAAISRWWSSSCRARTAAS